MIKTETVRPDIIGLEDYRELSPGVFQNKSGAVIIIAATGDEAIKITTGTPPAAQNTIPIPPPWLTPASIKPLVGVSS